MASHRSLEPDSRDQAPIDSRHERILLALADRTRVLDVIRASHALDRWSSWAHESSNADLHEGLSLLESERDRLQERLRIARSRRDGLDTVQLAGSQALSERIEQRLIEIDQSRARLEELIERLQDEVEVDSIELQRPLSRPDGTVISFVDLWVSLRVTYWRISRGTDLGDHERRVRYESVSAQHLTRSFAIHVRTTPASVVATLRSFRLIQAYAGDAIPILVCPPTQHRELLTSQGIGVFEWTTMDAVLPQDDTRVQSVGVRRQRRENVNRLARLNTPAGGYENATRRQSAPRARARR
jgi:HPt (histidine-containing phosphotransfer) domain-containing protein